MNRRELLSGAALLVGSGQTNAIGLGKLGRGDGRLGSLGVAGALTGGISFAGGYPLDAVTGVNITVAAGIGALTAACANGPLFDLVVGGVTTTINGVGPGYPDVKAIAAACGISPTSGIGGGQISKWYDQSGNGNHLVQTTTGSPQPSLFLIKGKIYLGFGGCLTQGDSGGLTAPFFNSSVSVNNQSFSFFAAINSYTSTNAASTNSAFYSAVLATTGGGATNIVLADQSSYVNSLTVPPGGTGNAFLADYTNAVSSKISPNIGIQPTIISATGSGLGTTIATNNSASTGPAMVAGTPSPVTIGVDPGSAPFAGRMQAVILSSSIFTTAQELAMRTALAAWSGVNLNINRANKLNVVIDGASSDEGQGSDPLGQYRVLSGGGYGYVEQLKDALSGHSVSWYNVAVSGNTIANCTTNYTSGFTPSTAFQPSSQQNIIIGPGSSLGPTLANNGGDGSAAYTDYVAWVTAVKNNSWTAIATILYPSGVNTGIDTFQNLLIANAATLGIHLIDMRSETRLVSIPIYANPDSHPTVAGSALYVPYILAFLQQFL
jgi:hypothetical protein